MTGKYQIIYWRDIPAQLKLKVERKRSSRPLSPRFMAAVDAAAMQAGKTDSEGYMDEWRMGDWEAFTDDPETVADITIAELEAVYPGDRLRKLVKQGGWEEQ